MNTGSRDEQMFLHNIERIAKALEQIVAELAFIGGALQFIEGHLKPDLQSLADDLDKHPDAPKED